MSQEIKRLIECTGDGYDMRSIVGVYDVATMKPEDLAKQRARHNREFVYADDYDRVVQERDALARRVAEFKNWVEAEKSDWSERNADRYWQMNRVLHELQQVLRPAPPAQEGR